MMLSPGNPMRRVLLSVLVFEAISVGLAVPGMILVSHVDPGRAALWSGAVVVVLLAAAGLLRRGPGYPLGWLAQVACLALGWLVPMMIAVGGLFALIWITSFVLGRRIEATPPPSDGPGAAPPAVSE